MVAIGPRPAGSPAIARTRDYIRQQLTASGFTVEEQRFEARTPIGPIAMVNLRATLPGAADGPRLVIGGHYDTKLFREFPFVGANDGGSSAAFLIELARVLKDRRSAVPLELLFLDGEEAVRLNWEGDDNTYGSRHYVEAARKSGGLARIGAFVLVDMVGDRDLRIKRESQSTGWLTDVIWAAARELKRPQFVDEATPIDDDHIPFLAAGIPAVDIIDLEYPAWHTQEDTLDKVSGASMQVVGEVLLKALPAIEKRLAQRP
jgi:Zn-dependent M28 family amino/carboxypeptidase